MSPAPDFLLAFAGPPLAACPMVVGGISCTAGAAAGALTVLLSAPGLMIRQPLLKAGSPLARCDYHAVAAPYRAVVIRAGELAGASGRGAAGRHIAKTAFCTALGDMLGVIAGDPWAAWEALAQAAWRAFSADPGYAAQLAAAGAKARPALSLEALAV